ncbi:MAG TPA: hypothetical protein VL485_15355 [Ktedonobacteraceae bacterium]|jgi:hypothetical protein|nr:hypothetical protein [Ktedonobacteraceae bacterium]
MFPDQFQSILNMMAIREMLKMWAKREQREKDPPEKRRSFMQWVWFCLSTLGIGMSKLGRQIEQVGFYVTWFALRKRVEDSPEYYD